MDAWLVLRGGTLNDIVERREKKSIYSGISLDKNFRLAGCIGVSCQLMRQTRGFMNGCVIVRGQLIFRL